jgi:hypothetical protein
MNALRKSATVNTANRWRQYYETMKYTINTPVIVKSFLGKQKPKKSIDTNENYWILIGKKGKIIDDHEINGARVLVLFEDNLDTYGLENHNPIKNSLWIKKSDLKINIIE